MNRLANAHIRVAYFVFPHIFFQIMTEASTKALSIEFTISMVLSVQQGNVAQCYKEI